MGDCETYPWIFDRFFFFLSVMNFGIETYSHPFVIVYIVEGDFFLKSQEVIFAAEQRGEDHMFSISHTS